MKEILPPKGEGEKPLLMKRSRSLESVNSYKHAKFKPRNETELSDEKTSSLKLEPDHSMHMLDFLEPPGELQKALEPFASSIPIDFSYLLHPISKLYTLIPQNTYEKIAYDSDVGIVETALSNVGKAFVGLAEITAAVKATYHNRFDLSKELKKTEAGLENVKSNLEKKRKVVRRLQHQIRLLKENHAKELKDREMRAVEAFKGSDEYEKILEEAHQQGIEECRYHIEQRRPHWDLSFLDIP